MREIKFRAWNGEKFRSDVNGMLDFCIDSDYMTVEQYTGLHDKNSKEIYEGDIVKLHVVILSPDDKVGFIEYSPKYGYCINFGKSIARQEYWAANDKHTIEVIGNIHENPELLEKTGED